MGVAPGEPAREAKVLMHKFIAPVDVGWVLFTDRARGDYGM